MTRLLWVAVPNGLTPTGDALVRVLVVPQLDSGTLSDYGLQDWPAILGETSFRVRIKTSAGTRAVYIDRQHDPVARSEVWRAFFGGTAGIVNQWSDKTQPTPVVAETHDTARAVAGTYRASTRDLAAPAEDTDAKIHQRIAAWHQPMPDGVHPAERPLPPVPPSPDFHQAVALLREHPAVLRDLGLIFELVLDPVDLVAGDPDERFLAVVPVSPLATPVPVTWSKYDITAAGFWPAPASNSRSGIRGGMLDLSDGSMVSPADPDQLAPPGESAPLWAIATFDVDGAKQALQETAQALADDPSLPPALPGLRSAGLLLVRPDRQSDVEARTSSASTRAGALGDQHLTADELTLGYRVDVRAGKDGVWRSICRRRVAYTVKARGADELLALGGSQVVAEEGHVKPFAATRQDDGTLRTDQVVLRWDGWSLVLPRMSLRDDGTGTTRAPAVELPYDFRWTFGRPGERLAEPDGPDDRLPRLRFATDYQMRVRVADVTGGGPRLEDVDGNERATKTILYTRHDPVRPPVLGRADGPFAPGGAIDRLVLRSDRGLTAAAFAAAEPRYASAERRTLSRPSISFEVAEQHGVFDDVDGPESDQRTWAMALSALDPTVDQTGTSVGLPDPTANGVAAWLPAAPGGLDAGIGDWSIWEGSTPKSLELEEETDPDAPRISLRWDGDRLVVRLAPGERALLELSSRITPGMQDHFAWYEWLIEDDVPLDSSLLGRNPVLTPPRRVELAHAVRRPLADPAWVVDPSARRVENATTATIAPAFTSLDTDSTGRLEVWASWRDWSDVGGEPVPEQLIDALTLDRGDPPSPQILHDFGDTKHRQVTYSLTAISRYRHCFFADEPDSLFTIVAQQDGLVTMPSTARPPPLTVVGTAPSFHWRTETQPDRIERVRSPRVRVEVARPWYQTGEGESLAVIAATEDAPPDGVRSVVSQIGRDPIVASPALPRYLLKNWFTAGVGAVTHAMPPEFDHPVDVVPHAVTCANDHWYADVAIADPTERILYKPFVRLAVARYQARSLPGLHLSTVVLTDLVPLLPERRLVVTRRASGSDVTLTGPGLNPPNTYEVIVETCDVLSPPGPDGVGLVALDAADDSIPAWRPVAEPLTAEVGATITVSLPAGSASVRLRVREIERISGIGEPPGPPELTQRTVYFDVVGIPLGWLTPG